MYHRQDEIRLCLNIKVTIKINDEIIRYGVIASEYKEMFIGLISHYHLMIIGNMLSRKSIKEITLYIPMCIN